MMLTPAELIAHLARPEAIKWKTYYRASLCAPMWVDLIENRNPGALALQELIASKLEQGTVITAQRRVYDPNVGGYYDYLIKRA